MGLTQIRRGTLDAPWSAAPWASVVRRTAVVVGFVAYGLFTGQLDTAVFGAFGALQLGLGEAVLPWRRLFGLVVIEVAALTAVGFVAAWTSGTWWTVPLLAAIAYAHGVTFTAGQVPRAVGVGTLAIGVIFAGLPVTAPGSAAVWLGLGAACQGLVWLLVWPWERVLTIRRALANRIRDIVRIVGYQRLSGRDSNNASAAVDDLRATIAASGVADRQAALSLVDAIDDVRRGVIAWRVLKAPGLAERMSVREVLRDDVRVLDESVGRADHRQSPREAGEQWASAEALAAAIDTMQDRIDSLRTGESGRAPLTSQAPSPGSHRSLLRPDLSQLRHGLRLAIAIAIAQAVTLVIPINHSFWIPLTVVFVVRPEWYTTVIRSAARVLGNLLAVVLIPVALAVAGGWDLATLLLVALIAGVGFRNFSGNYIAASFGVAGTILVLDQTLGTDPFLYEWRIVATVVGALIGLAVSAVIPAYRGHEGGRLLARVVSGLSAWSQSVCRGIIDPSDFDPGASRVAGEQERNNLIHMRPAVEAALLEPRPNADPRVLSVAVEAADRAHLCLLALSFYARLLHEGGRPGLDVGVTARGIQDSFGAAARCLGDGESVSVDQPAPEAAGTVPRTPEDLAVVMQALRLRQAATDLAAAASWATSEGLPSQSQ